MATSSSSAAARDDVPRTFDEIQPVAVHTPKPGTLVRPVLPTDGTRITMLFRTWASELKPEDVAAVHDYVNVGLTSINFGSMCSGSDIPAIVMQHFAAFCEDFYQIDTKYRHQFSCEKDEQKRSFISEVHPDVGHLFRDVHEMCAPMAFDVKKNSDVLTPCCDVLAAGFPCQDCSALNPHASSDANRACIADGTLRTGTVYAGILDYIAKCGHADPEMVLLENVATFKNRPKPKIAGAVETKDRTSNSKTTDRLPSNLDMAAHFMRERCSRVLHAWQLSPELFGVPQMRNRIWMTSFRTSDLDGLMTDAQYHDELNKIMDLLVGFEASPIDDYLLPAECLRHGLDLLFCWA